MSSAGSGYSTSPHADRWDGPSSRGGRHLHKLRRLGTMECHEKSTKLLISGLANLSPNDPRVRFTKCLLDAVHPRGPKR